MARFFGWLLLLSVAVYAIKVALFAAIVLLMVAGLIFRTKATLGLLLFLGIIAVIEKFPTACYVGLIFMATAMVGVGVVRMFTASDT